MSQLDHIDSTQGWRPRMSRPASFPWKAQRKYQKRIDQITGTRDSRPIVKLAWAPEELRWMPHPLPDDPPGYVFPIFCVGRVNGELVSAPRFVLLQRAEPQHYAASWEASRYSVHQGRVWDWRGPCPPERYTELRAHCYHDGECCPCRGDTCECGAEYDHCWGKYLDPNERLLDWIRETNQMAQADSDVDPNRDVNQHSAPNAQRQWVNDHQKAEQKRIIGIGDLDRETQEFWRRKPVSINLKKTESGIILLN